jgi:hypothetical protein
MIVQVLREERSKDNKQKGKKEWAEPYQTTPNSQMPLFSSEITSAYIVEVSLSIILYLNLNK